MNSGMVGTDQSKYTGNAGIYVRFHLVYKVDEQASEKEGRVVHKTVEYIEKVTPGDKDNIVNRPASDKDKREFANVYAAFKADKSQDEASGTLLSVWGGIGGERVADYSYGKVMTVEQLAGMPDEKLHGFGPLARKEREKAQAFVEFMEGNAPIAKLQSEIDRKNEEVSMLKQALKDQGDRLERLEKGKKGDK